MSPDRNARMLLAALASLSLLGAGCADKEEAQPAAPGVGTTASESRKARVRFKGLTRLQNDLSQALSVPAQELCTELGTSACAEVHRIALGGVMPYTRGIHEPLPLRSVSNAAAVDRLVLSACARRAELDFGGSPAVFGDLAAAGATDEAARKTAHSLYNALLRRDETEEERSAVVAFFAEQKQKGTQPRDLATITCYAVGTSVEALFY